MQTLTRTNMVVIKDYDHMIAKDENMNRMKLTHLLSIFPLNFRPPFYTSTFTSENLITFLDVHTSEK